MWVVHREYTPWFRRLVKKEASAGKVVVLSNPEELKLLHWQLDIEAKNPH